MNFASTLTADRSKARVQGPVLGVIPARLGSVRLPRKPLAPLLGRPLIEWVWRRARSMKVFDDVVVATDSAEVHEVCRRLRADVVMTSATHASGTDRVAEVASAARYRDAAIIVNVQGDEPLLDETHVRRCVDLVRSGWPVATCAAPFGVSDDADDPNAVKVVRTSAGRALYFTRARAPFRREDDPDSKQLETDLLLRHIGLYAYRREALMEWVALPPSPLERLERLEQLRALEAGMPIGVAVVDEAAPGVDTLSDVRAVEELLRALKLPEVTDSSDPT